MCCNSSFSYSLDKVKIKGKLNLKKHMWIPNYTKISYWVQFGLPEWCECIMEKESFAPFKYRYFFSLRVKGEKEGTFAISEWYNGDFKDSKQRPEWFIIEYNPNKSGKRIYDLFCNSFIFKLTDILSFDIAYDIKGYSPEDVVLDTTCDIMTYGKSSNKTLYIAPKEDRSGRVKIYAKDKERENKGEFIDKTLRIEASVKNCSVDMDSINLSGKTGEELTKVVNHLNSVKIKQKELQTDDWKLLALSRLAPQDLEAVLSKMSSNTRVKYKELLVAPSYFTLNLDLPILCFHISNLLKPYTERIKVK